MKWKKICELSFDEIHVNSKLCYDSKLDEIQYGSNYPEWFLQLYSE